MPAAWLITGSTAAYHWYAITDSKTSEVLSYIQTVGTYYSYDGIYWENTLTRVYPHKVMVVEFSTTPS